ncbi:MAG: M23 family metallopeptidase, partial [Oligoflexia bacterium]|nr:M23 family metallopeptidase [Oligoflexia bacterium]
LEHSSSSFLAMGPLSHASFPDLHSTINVKPGTNPSLHRGPASTPSAHSDAVSSPVSVDSIMVYMDHLDKKSQLIREDIIVLTERLYERRDIMSSTPSILPAKGWISSHFGYRQYPFTGAVSLHEGMDIAAFPGTPVYAPADGVVVFAGYRKGYGNVIVIDHGYELSTLYGHLSDIMVSRWQKTQRRQVIGTIGSTGNSSGPHLHYEVRISNVPVDPSKYILDEL